MQHFIDLQGWILLPDGFCLRGGGRQSAADGDSESRSEPGGGTNPLHPTEEWSPGSQNPTRCPPADQHQYKKPCGLFRSVPRQMLLPEALWFQLAENPPCWSDLEHSVEFLLASGMFFCKLPSVPRRKQKIRDQYHLKNTVPCASSPWSAAMASPQLCGRCCVRQCAGKARVCGLTDLEVTQPDWVAVWRRQTSTSLAHWLT